MEGELKGRGPRGCRNDFIHGGAKSELFLKCSATAQWTKLHQFCALCTDYWSL